MTIRDQFQPRITEFISDLETFATGSYLTAEERERWDQPFDPAVLGRVTAELERYLDNLDRLPGEPLNADLNPLVEQTIARLSAINEEQFDAVLEPEEFEQLNEFFRETAAATGATEDTLHHLPIFE